VIVVECKCADGSTVLPLFIVNCTSLNSQVVSDSIPGDWDASFSEKGWTSNIDGLKWLQDCYKPAIQENVAGGPRVLICNGHCSHITGGFVNFCMKNNIWLLVIPPYASYLLQSLDLAVFDPLKTYLLRYLQPVTKSGTHQVQKHELFSAYAVAPSAAFHVLNITSGFRYAGLFLFLPGLIIR
jgi:hypothetical protein